MIETRKPPMHFRSLMFGLAAGLALPLHAAGDQPPSRNFYLDSQRSWYFVSFLPNEPDAKVLGLEFESYFELGDYKFKNLSYIELADYPRQIPGQPPGNPSAPPTVDIQTGINDLLTGFWVTKKGQHPTGNHHFSWGAALQMPTASSPALGSGLWSAGPSFDYEYKTDRLLAGAIVLQLWSFAGDSGRKRVNMFMAKPFITYKLSDEWDFIYMPYGNQIYWDKPKGENAYVPLGGGFQRRFDNDVNFSVQFFKNVVSPTNGTKYDLRFMLEFVLK
jgi:hypothetical protein